MKKEVLESSCIPQLQKIIKELDKLINEKRVALGEMPLARPGDLETNLERQELYETIRELEGQHMAAKNHLSFLQDLLTAPAPVVVGLSSLVAVENCHEVFFIVPKPETLCERPSTEHGKLCCISPKTPFCRAMSGLRKGEKFDFQNKTYKVIRIE